MLRLLSLLQTGRHWSANDLAQATSSTPRTLRRDIEFLRDLGYPVESTRGPGGHYRLVAGRALPPLMLEDDEAVATVLGLELVAGGDGGDRATAEVARRAGDKLRRLLPTRLRRRTDDLLAATEIAPTTPGIPAPALLTSLTGAISRQEILGFTYGTAGSTATREVEPVRLLRLNQRWYLFAWDLHRRDWRTFRLDRITGSLHTGGPFEARQLPAEDLVSHMEKHFRGMPVLTVVLIIHASASVAASNLYRLDGSLEPLSGDTCRYVAHVDSYQWLTLVLALSDLEFTVESPEAFREHLHRSAVRLLRATQ